MNLGMRRKYVHLDGLDNYHLGPKDLKGRLAFAGDYDWA